ncbi:hypothetical protein JCM10207_006122 [Rhodosporidiobolus poonsookiae]
MDAPIVLSSQQLPGLIRSLSRASSRRPSAFAPSDSEDESPSSFRQAKPVTALPHELDGLENLLKQSTLGGLGGPGCTCGDCPECVSRRRQARRGSSRNAARMDNQNYANRRTIRDFSLKPDPTGPDPSAAYLREAAEPSKPLPADSPLVVISLDGVLDARLPYHLSGGWTDVLARPYLTTLMEYLLHQHSPWSFCFFSSLPRKEALKTLKSLKLPTGGPEKDERDGVVGLFARDDMRGWSGGKLELKDLDWMWEQLGDEEGRNADGTPFWGPHNTVVLTDYPANMRKQPGNYILVPRLEYKSTVRPRDDQFLLLMIAVLKDLETETSFPAHIKEMRWNDLKIWTSTHPDCVNERNEYLNNAVRVCADMRISITAFTGN